jgi:hypothetical protein
MTEEWKEGAPTAPGKYFVQYLWTDEERTDSILTYGHIRIEEDGTLSHLPGIEVIKIYRWLFHAPLLTEEVEYLTKALTITTGLYFKPEIVHKLLDSITERAREIGFFLSKADYEEIEAYYESLK